MQGGRQNKSKGYVKKTGLPPPFVIVVNRRDGASTFERLQEKDFNVWLETYSVGELWSKNVISGGPVYE